LLHEAAIEVAFNLMVPVLTNGSALSMIEESKLAKVVPGTFNPNVTGLGQGDAAVTR
jgi:hypothetical protein